MAEVLKGGINNTKYIWHSSENACKDCQALDGKEYDFEEDIPDKPHPNCQCWVEERENESCDCEEKINSILEKADEVEGEVESMFDEIETIRCSVENKLKELNEVIEIISNNYSEIDISKALIAIGFGNDFFNITIDGLKTYTIFSSLKAEMETIKVNFEDSDKYFHAKANCESASLGIIETLWAVFWSVAKEIIDFLKKVLLMGMDAEFVLADCIQDLKADLYGLSKASSSGSCSEKVIEAPVLFPSPKGEKYGKNKK